MRLSTTTNADMSYTKTLSFKFEVLFGSMRKYGIIETFSNIIIRLYYRVLNIDFFTTESLFNQALIGEHKECGTAYVPINKIVLNKILNELYKIDTHIKKGYFIDFGSGKGFALSIAAKFGFKKVIGVEFANELYLQGVKNIKKLQLNNIQQYNQDASEYKIDKKTTVVYLFNPFNEIVMQKVSKNIISLKDKFENNLYIIYINPSCEYVFDKNFELIYQNRLEKEDFRVNIYKLV